uniref:Uncharacterized protein n=1 Tax=Nicotiana tabacum TaxID=4097 RepID=A0A1S4AW50_TOBAC
MNQAAALKKKVSNPNKVQSPMKNIGFDFQYRSSAELAKKFRIKREKLANDHKDKAMKEQAPLGVKRKSHMPATSEGQRRQMLKKYPMNEHEIELENFVAQAEVGDDEFVRDEDVNIDCAAYERDEVTFDKGQTVGPTDKRVSDLTNFIGTIARNPRFITLMHTSWHAVSKDIKQRMWEYVNSKFLIPAEGEKWIMAGLRDARRRHKRNIKKKHFNKNAIVEDMLQNRQNEIPEIQFRQLLEYWKDSNIQAMCQLNSENRKKQKWRHRMGPINFARIRVALRASKENNEEPSKSEIFIATSTKKGKEVQTDTQIAIISNANRQSYGETTDDAFRAVAD